MGHGLRPRLVQDGRINWIPRRRQQNFIAFISQSRSTRSAASEAPDVMAPVGRGGCSELSSVTGNRVLAAANQPSLHSL